MTKYLQVRPADGETGVTPRATRLPGLRTLVLTRVRRIAQSPSCSWPTFRCQRTTTPSWRCSGRTGRWSTCTSSAKARTGRPREWPSSSFESVHMQRLRSLHCTALRQWRCVRLWQPPPACLSHAALRRHLRTCIARCVRGVGTLTSSMHVVARVDRAARRRWSSSSPTASAVPLPHPAAPGSRCKGEAPGTTPPKPGKVDVGAKGAAVEDATAVAAAAAAAAAGT